MPFTRAGRCLPQPGAPITLEIGDLYNLHDLTASFPVRWMPPGGRAVGRREDRTHPGQAKGSQAPKAMPESVARRLL